MIELFKLNLELNGIIFNIILFQKLGRENNNSYFETRTGTTIETASVRNGRYNVAIGFPT